MANSFKCGCLQAFFAVLTAVFFLLGSGVLATAEKKGRGEAAGSDEELENFSSKDESVVPDTISLEDAGKVRDLLIQWRDAWERKDLKAYISFYSDGFKWQGLNRNEYGRKKGQVFARAGTIRVTLRGISIRREGELIVLTFMQVYQADNHRDEGFKDLFLVKEGGKWLINREEWRPKE